MDAAELATDWQTLGNLAKEAAALPKETFLELFHAPFLLELNPEAGQVASEDTRDFDPNKVRAAEGPSPSLTNSQIRYFGAGTAFSIGRGEGNSIRCQQETVSEAHCMLEQVGSLWSVRDAGSKNGTFLNGQAIGAEQLPLKFGSKIMLGEAQFLFLSPDDACELLQDLSKEPRIRPRSMGKYRAEFKKAGGIDEIRASLPGPFLVVQAPKGREPAAGGGAVSSNTITLSADELKKGVDKNVADAVFHLEGHDLVRIGRASVAQIHLPLGAISNLHAALVRGDDGWHVQDLGAKNGTYVWGERLDVAEKKALESGTEVVLGNIKSIFFELPDLVTYCAHRDTLV